MYILPNDLRQFSLIVGAAIYSANVFQKSKKPCIIHYGG